MDIASHALWGGVAFGRKKKAHYWWAFFIGFAPDIFSFGIFWLMNILGISDGPSYSGGRPDFANIPEYVYQLYNATHSFIVFALIFGIIFLIRKKPFWPLAAWGVHIIIDIPSHSLDFFATPFLWPISNYRFDGISWGNPIIFFPNLVLLAMAYSIWFYYHKTQKNRK